MDLYTECPWECLRRWESRESWTVNISFLGMRPCYDSLIQSTCCSWSVAVSSVTPFSVLAKELWLLLSPSCKTQRGISVLLFPSERRGIYLWFKLDDIWDLVLGNEIWKRSRWGYWGRTVMCAEKEEPYTRWLSLRKDSSILGLALPPRLGLRRIRD